MKKILIYIGTTIVLFATMPLVLAQKSTELFIPIGQSPGASAKYTVMGTIDSVDMDNRTIFMQDSAGKNYDVKLTDKTKIYLDKSQLKKTNEMGTIADCSKGVYCEVLYESHARKETGEAEWIKLRVTEEMQE
jgi:hypothetical protein